MKVHNGDRCKCGHGPILHIPGCVSCGNIVCPAFDLGESYEDRVARTRAADTSGFVRALEETHARRTSAWLFNQPREALPEDPMQPDVAPLTRLSGGFVP